MKPQTLKLVLVIGLVPAAMLCLTHGQAWALDPSWRISQYALDHWHVKEGLRQGTIQAIAQTPDGYLWLGTRDGLVRFDGVQFRTFHRSDTPSIHHDNISDLAVAADGTLWIGQSEGGLTAWGPGGPRHFGKAEGLGSDSVRSLAMAPDGTLWIGTYAGGVTQLKDGHARVLTSREGLPDNTVRGVLAGAGGVWVGTDRGVARIVNGKVETPAFAAALGPVLINCFLEDRRGQLWIGTGGKGLARWADGRLEFFGAEQGMVGEVVRSIEEDRDGNIWVATGRGLNRLSGTRFEAFTTAEGLPGDYVRKLSEDREGSLWIGLFGGGLSRMKAGRFVNWSREEGLRSDFVFSVRQIKDGSVWMASNGGGVNRLSGGRVATFSAAEGMPGTVGLAVGELRVGMPLFGFKGHGLWTWSQGRFRQLPVDEAVDRGDISDMEEDADGALWLATNEGLRVRRHGVWSAPLKRAQGGLQEPVGAILVRRDGSVWTAGRFGVGRLEGSAMVEQRDRAGALLPKTHSLYEDSDGNLWAATNGKGLWVLHAGTWGAVDQSNGLPSGVLYAILDDGRGGLWMSTDRGVVAARRTELLAAAQSHDRQVSFRVYGMADGMRSSECNGGGGGQPMGWRSQDGRLWFPTVRGVAVIDPNGLRPYVPPQPVRVAEVHSGREVHEMDGTLTLGPDARDIEFHYQSLGLRAPEGLRFRYRLDGFDRDWVEAGNRRSAFYTNLPPGRYVFRAEVTDGDGGWIHGIPAEVELRPHYYQTWWFRGAAALWVAMLLVWLLRVRAARSRAEGEAAAHAAAYREMERRVAERTSELDHANRDLQSEITERLEVEKALRRQKDDYETIFNLSPTQIWIKDTNNRCLRINRQVTADLGLAREDVEGKTLDELFPQFAPGYFVDDQEVIASGKPKLGIEERIVAANGEVRRLLTDKVPRRDGAGTTIGVVSFSHDVTERHRLEEQLRQAQRLESLGRLAGGVAHDFNNLLTVINGYAEVLERNHRLEAHSRKMVSEIGLAGQKAALLTQQLLAFSRSQQLRTEVLDLNVILASLETILRRLIGESILLVIEPGGPLHPIEADAGQAQQVLMNLTLNARDAMPSGGALRIATGNRRVDASNAQDYLDVPPGEYAELTVDDTGEGMDEETQRRLFEPFFSTKPLGRGTGLGLSTVYGVVKQSGGHILVRSVVGRGTTFRILFPAVAEPPVALGVEESCAEVAPSIGRGAVVLLVEDQREVRSLVHTVLEQAGFQVMDAGDVPHAEKIWQRCEGSLRMVLTDVLMPGPSGIDLAMWIRQRRPGFPVLLMSGFVDRSSMSPEQAALVAKMALPMIQKPFSPAALVAEIERLLAVS